MDIIEKLKRKLEAARIKIETVVQLCVEADKNKDKVIHMDDLKAIFKYLLGDECPSRRDLHALESLLKVGSRGEIDYTRLEELLAIDSESRRKQDVQWDDDKTSAKNIKLEAGSLGEWLQRASCPLEIQNYKRLIHALEAFEKESGVRIASTREGLVVPLGPDLRASINFFIQ